MLFECIYICVFGQAYKFEIRGSLVYLVIVTYLSSLLKFSHSVLDWTAVLDWTTLCGILKKKKKKNNNNKKHFQRGLSTTSFTGIMLL